MKTNHPILLLFVFFAFAFGIRLYWLIQKNGLHVDETASVALACYNDYIITKNYEVNKQYTGKEIKEISLCDNDSLKNAVEDIYRLWLDNRDSPHTNLYYSLLRISLAGLKTGDIKIIIFRGGVLNLLFFTLSFFLFFLLLKRLFENDSLPVLLAVLCTFLSPASISNTLFLRPYQMQETAFILFCCLFCKYFYRKKYIVSDGVLYVNQKLLMHYAFFTAIALLTGYYTVIFISFFGLYIIYNNYKTKNHKEIIAYFLILFLALVFSQTIYTRYMSGFLSHRARQIKNTFFRDFIGNISASFLCIVTLLKEFYAAVPVIMICTGGLIHLKYFGKKIIKNKLGAFIFMAALLYMIVVIITAPYKTLRYVMPVFPFFILLPLMIVRSFDNKKISITAMLLLIICFAANSFNINHIENVYKDKPGQYEFTKEENIPVFVLSNVWWIYADLVPYFNDNQTYIFIDSINDISMTDYDAIYLITRNSAEIDSGGVQNYNIVMEYTVPYFLCRKLIKQM